METFLQAMSATLKHPSWKDMPGPGLPPKKTREPLALILFQLRSGQLFEAGVDQATKIDVTNE